MLQHLRSAKHQEYASNSANFFSLDNLIAQGNNFSEFIASVKARRGRKGCLNSTRYVRCSCTHLRTISAKILHSSIVNLNCVAICVSVYMYSSFY